MEKVNFMSNNILLIFTLVALQIFCSCGKTIFEKEKYGNCADEIQNQNEEGIDCGGHCLPCANCNDGVKNNNETGIDCGGTCISCIPDCSTPQSVIQYTIYPNTSGPGLKDQSTVGYSGFNLNTSVLSISFNGGYMDDLSIQFLEKFNPFTEIPLNETAVFTALEANTTSDINITNRSQVKIEYKAYLGFNYYNGWLERGQIIRLTRISNTELKFVLCNALGSRGDRLNMNTVVD